MRSPEEMLHAYEAATKESPLIIANGEAEAFLKAMKISCARQDERMGSQSGSKITICDRDKLLANGVLSPLDQKTAFHNRKDWAEHLKRNDCVEFGNDFNKSTEKKREIKGDFNCYKELAQATNQIADKYGY